MLQTWWPIGASQPAVSATLLPVPTATEISKVVRGFSVNATHNALGKACVWRVKYGPTAAYGTTTPDRPLPGKLAAYYRETFPASRNGWAGGVDGSNLVAGGGYVTYTDPGGGSNNDSNHIDGIGWVHLVSYLHIGWFQPDTARAALHLGGHWPDLRGAMLSMKVRSNNWLPKGSRLHTWIQAFGNRYYASDAIPDYANWAFSGRNFNEEVAAATDWTTVNWSLSNRTSDWTYAGQNALDVPVFGERYFYSELDSRMAACNLDVFPFMAVDINPADPPTGSIDLDDFQMTYRQTNLCHPSSGATLTAEPAGGTGSQYLTDGWGNVATGGAGEWQSVANPLAAGPQAFVYAFANPVAVLFLKLHNSTANPSRDYKVEVSDDGGLTWALIHTGILPDTHALGPNYLFDHYERYGAYGVLHPEYAAARGSNAVNNWSVWVPLHNYPMATVTHLRVTITSGWQIGRWGLGSIEAYGEGGVFKTEDADTDVNQDVVVPAGTYHYCVEFEDEDNVVTTGDDQIIVVV